MCLVNPLDLAAILLSKYWISNSKATAGLQVFEGANWKIHMLRTE